MAWRGDSERGSGRDSGEPLVSGGGFVDDQDVARARKSGKNIGAKVSLLFNVVVTVALMVMIGMYFADYNKNHHNNKLLKELLENQQNPDVNEFFQKKVLEALYPGPPDVVWPPEVLPPILFPSPSPSPGARSAHERGEDGPDANVLARTHINGALHMGGGKSVGELVCEQQTVLLDTLEVRPASGKRDKPTIGEAVDEINQRGRDEEDDDDDDDCPTPTPAPSCPGCACTAEIAAAVHNITTNVTSQLTYQFANTNNIIVSYHYGDILPRLDSIAECCAENTGLLEGLTEAEAEERLDNQNWRFWGRTPDNHGFSGRDASNVDIDNVADLAFKCDLPYIIDDPVGASNAQITIVGDLALFPDADRGNLWCYNRFTCELVWHKVTAQIFEDHIDAEGSDVKINASISQIPARQTLSSYRTADGKERLVFGAPSDRFSCSANGDFGCLGLSTYLISLDLYTGEYVWHTKTGDQAIPEDFIAHYAGSMTLVGEYGYTGTTSFANVFTLFGLPATYIGRVEKFRLEDGAIMWKKYLLPTGLGAGSWSGASVWARIAVDEEAGRIYYGTGNGHYHPEDAEACFTSYPDISNSSVWGAANKFCHAQMIAAYEHPLPFDSIIAADIDTGDFIWTYTPGGLDTFNVACGSEFGPHARDGGGDGCHGFQGPDWDFGGQITIVVRNGEKHIVAGQKSGVVHSLRASDGEMVWMINTGPAGTTGGVHWGGSYSPETGMFYATNAGGAAFNEFGEFVTAFTELSGGIKVCQGAVMNAIDVESGTVVWQSYDPWANNTVTGDFPPECIEASSYIGLADIFKKDWPYRNAAGMLVSALETATLGIPCPRNSTTGPAGAQTSFNARIHGMDAIANGVIAYGSATGNVYLHDTITGHCLHHVACPDGSIYGGVTFAGDQMLVACGYNKLGLGTGGNVTRVFELA